jgi:hypothetical protein
VPWRKCSSRTWGTTRAAHWQVCAGEHCSSWTNWMERAAQRHVRAGEQFFSSVGVNEMPAEHIHLKLYIGKWH